MQHLNQQRMMNLQSRSLKIEENNIMAIVASAPITDVEYIVEEDREDENPTRFKLKPLDGQQYMGVMAEGNIDDDGMMSFSESTMKKTLKYGLIGWDNFTDAESKAIKFSRLNFGRLPVGVLTELFSEIIRMSSLNEEDSKN